MKNMSSGSDLIYKNYLRNLSVGETKNFHILPWGVMLIRNCYPNGRLYDVDNFVEYKKMNEKKMAYFKVKTLQRQWTLIWSICLS